MKEIACLGGASAAALVLMTVPALAADAASLPCWMRQLDARSLADFKERRRGGVADGQLQLVQRWQVVKIVRHDRAAGQLVDCAHGVGARNLPPSRAFPEADGRLADAQSIRQCSLSQRLFLAPLRQPHPEPPGTGVEPDYCARLYFNATYRWMPDANYFDLQSNVLVMRPGNRLRELRRAAGLTQVKLADATGVSQPTISELENGSLSMDIQWMRAFARVLHCAPSDLLADEDNPNRLSNDERELVERFRVASAAQKQNVARVVEALVPPPANGDEDEAGAAA